MELKFYLGQLQAVINSNSLYISIILVVTFIFLSFLTCAIPSEIENFRGTNIEFAMRSEIFKWWLLISIFVTLPSLSISLLDLLRPWPKIADEKKIHMARVIPRALKFLMIALPNTTLYFLLCWYGDQIGFARLACLQNAIFYAQTLTLIGCILCSTFGHPYNFSSQKLDFKVENRTVEFLFMFSSFKFFLLLSTISSTTEGKLAFLLLSSICLLLGLLLLTVTIVKLSLFLFRSMKGYEFVHYDQMHDFFRMIGIIVFSFYTFAFYVQTGQLWSPTAVYEQTSNSLVAFIVGKVLLIIYLAAVEQNCLIFEANLKREQLRVRLDMLRYISHEMRSPLNTAFMGLQMSQDSIESLAGTVKLCQSVVANSDFAKGSGGAAESMQKIAADIEDLSETTSLIKESASVALETLNEMLTFDKIEEKKLVLETDDVDIWKFVSETVRPFRLNAATENVLLTVECMDLESDWLKNVCIKADRFKLNQVLRNFLSNALKFCNRERGEVMVTVERRPLSASRVVRSIGPRLDEYVTDDVVRVNVRDNGIGISTENQKKLFGQYVQFNAGQAQKGGGSGLGLWISKTLVEMHGGVAGAESDGMGKGCSFYFELPLMERKSSELVDLSIVEPTATVEIVESPAPVLSENADVRMIAVKSHSCVTPVKRQDSNFALDEVLTAVIKNKPKSMGSTDFSIPSPFARSRSSEDSDEQNSGGDNTTSSRRGSEKGSSKMTITGATNLKSDNYQMSKSEVRCHSDGFEASNDDILDKRYSMMHVLIVDDTATTRKITKKWLQSLGFTVEEAADGLLFLEKIGESLGDCACGSGSVHPDPGSDPTRWINSRPLRKSFRIFDFVLMDDNMPNMSGPEATAAARAAGYSGLIFGLTGNTFNVQLENFVAKGADMVFTKPLDQQKLIKALKAKLPDKIK